jgi:hypothetical protein
MKKKIKYEFYSKTFDGDMADVRFSDFPPDIQPNDIVEIGRDEGLISENNSYDSYTELVIIREREETDEEYRKRIDEEDSFKIELRQRRYDQYLKLKKEFDS